MATLLAIVAVLAIPTIMCNLWYGWPSVIQEIERKEGRQIREVVGNHPNFFGKAQVIVVLDNGERARYLVDSNIMRTISVTRVDWPH